MDSLEIVNKFIDYINNRKILGYNSCLIDLDELQKIKFDLKNYKNIKELLKELFKEIDIGYNFNCDREPAYEYEIYFNDNGGSDRLINEDLYMILLKLFKIVGDKK